jgi:multidrug transporter EmrE-like cation transporter
MYGALAFAVAASVSMSTGLYLMKREVDRVAARGAGRGPASWRVLARNPWWIAGVALQPVGYALYMVALASAPLSVVHVMLNGGIVLFVLLAVLRLGERAERFEWAGVALIVVALLLLGTSDPPIDPAHPLARRLPSFSLVVVALSALALVLDGSARRPVGLSVASGLMLGLGSVFAKTVTSAPSLTAAMAGFRLPLTAAANVVGFVLMQAALQAGRGVVVMPLFSGLSNLVPIVGGMVVFGESLPDHGPGVLSRPVAFALAIGGGVLLGAFGRRASAD